MFKKGDYVQSISGDYIVLVNEIYGDSFNGVVVESDFKSRKVGMSCDCWGTEYFKKINYKKHEESENDDHVRDIIGSRYVPKTRAINPEKFLIEYCLNFGEKTFGIDFSKDIKEEKVENEIKKEDVRVVRKLEDLDEHRNSSGLRLSYSPECDEHDEGLEIMGENGDTGIFIIESNLWVLKGMGFEFDYKPKRTEEEIMNDLVEKTFKFGEGNYILIKHEHGCYDYMNNMSFYTPNQKYYSLESLKKVVKELNEIQED